MSGTKQLIYVSLLIISTLYGNVESRPDPRIYGGQEAEPGQFPYMLSFRNSDHPNSLFCGGSILNEEWVITAGHCLSDYYAGVPKNLVIGVGTNDLNEEVELHHILKIIVHPDYDEIYLEDDIALAKLDGKLTLSETVQKIEIGSADENDTCVVSGWGGTETGYPTKLRFLETVALSVDDCIEKWYDAPDDYVNCYRGEKQICTFTKDGEGNCFGDSGGPLASNGKLVGIVSSGLPCAVGFPDLYTRTSSYADWISETIANN